MWSANGSPPLHTRSSRKYWTVPHVVCVPNPPAPMRQLSRPWHELSSRSNLIQERVVSPVNPAQFHPLLTSKHERSNHQTHLRHPPLSTRPLANPMGHPGVAGHFSRSS